MRTAITDLLGIEFPILGFSHCRDVVAAISKAGGMGVLGAVAHSPEQLEVDAHGVKGRVEGLGTIESADDVPLRWLRHFAVPAQVSKPLAQPSPAYVEETHAPLQLEDFARASGDLNPLHRDPHAAALAGFDRPIVHGQWTAARAVATAVQGFANGDGRRVRGIDVRFTAPALHHSG